MRRLLRLLFGKPSASEKRKAEAIRRMFENAEKQGFTYKVDRWGIHRVELED